MELTTTSYAILGLLAIKPWTTYELAQQMERSLNGFWPRAQSRIYEEPKRLAALGLAKATNEMVGRRPRTVYAITAKGRRSLQAWLGEPGAGPQLECEALLKVFFSEQATAQQVRDNIAALHEYAARANAANVAFARLYRDTGGPFPDRLASILLTGKFLTDFADMVGRWAEWADGVVADWPENATARAAPTEVLDEVANRPVRAAPLPG